MFKKENYFVYLIHFDKPYWNTCIHYLGYTNNIERRFKEHLKGKGSKLIKYALNKGCSIIHKEIISRHETRIEARRNEIFLKKKKSFKTICSMCLFNNVKFK